ncbi:protein-tyrosine sulfotransferase 2-like [Budorcas taxicolor]|uniref:protein-tyrosine sulfotransferase 2-like n=1 Tax=Budorcas taxicolor TaxID=37181 RepID=UPI00228450DA|nr:protein-tyrosine sulfotransferase 2-like [Budorcas taxicolor]
MPLIFVGSVPQGGTMLDPVPMRWERRPHPPPHTGCAPGLVQVRLREAAAGRGLQPGGDRRAPRASLSPPQQRLLYPQVLHRPVGLSPTPGSCRWCRTASASLASTLVATATASPRGAGRRGDVCPEHGGGEAQVPGAPYEQRVLCPWRSLKLILCCDSTLHQDDLICKPCSPSPGPGSTGQALEPVSLEALSKWTGHAPGDVLRGTGQTAPPLAQLSYDPYANPPDYDSPSPTPGSSTAHTRS